jgi:hypothetical protein
MTDPTNIAERPLAHRGRQNRRRHRNVDCKLREARQWLSFRETRWRCPSIVEFCDEATVEKLDER